MISRVLTRKQSRSTSATSATTGASGYAPRVRPVLSHRCMNFGEREDMENLAEQRLAEVKERFPNAVLGDNGIVHVIYLYAEDPNLYHKFAVFARNDRRPDDAPP